MVQVEQEDMPAIAPLFSDTQETLIWSCLQGHMGAAWADSAVSPACAQIITGDFCFFAGDYRSSEARLLAANIPAQHTGPWLLMIPENEGWGTLIEEVYPDAFSKFDRYAIKKEKDVFDKVKLRLFIKAQPAPFQPVPVNEDIYNLSRQEKWSADLCSQFASYDDYHNRGLGYAILHKGRLICGASSYTVYNGGIEIEIGTREEYRRRGLAAACASALILECLQRGLYPSWDAANLASVALAEKLGYHFDCAYTTYAINCVELKKRSGLRK